MDRFRFRFWDKKQKKYEDISKLINQEGELVSFAVRDDLSKFYDIEQCTGLKDRNGKLIYENDIVREISKKEPEWEEYITEVKWGKCGFNLYSDEDYDFEVIGNIHENADLLEI